MAPRDELEAMLASQMGAVHAATMMLARRLNHVQTIPQQDAAKRALNKLARTYAMQMEALKRYRTSGQQKVTVEHVTVNAGRRLSGLWKPAEHYPNHIERCSLGLHGVLGQQLGALDGTFFSACGTGLGRLRFADNGRNGRQGYHRDSAAVWPPS